MAELTEAEVLRLIEDGDEFGPLDAEDILKLEMPGAKRRFMAIDKSLRGFLADVRKTFPDANYYTASGGFHLMLGNPHASDHEGRSQQQLVALSGKANIGDGDF